MTLFAKKPLTNSTVTVSSITNSLDGASGLLQQQILDGDVDNGFYQVILPWNVNLNGVLYDNLYVSTKSFISFGTAAVNASPTSPETNKILLGNRENTSVFDTYVKNFYADTEGVSGSRTFRMRYEGGFKVLPTNITSSSLTNNLLGRASLQEYQLNTAFEIPWNINFNTSEGTIQNAILVSEYSQILFGKFNLINSTNQFEQNGNALNIGYTAASSGSGVWAGVEGVSPNRTYRIRYEGFDDSNIPTVWEVTLYENNKNIVDVQTGNVTDFFTLDLNGWYSDYDTTLVVDLTNTSGNYNNRGTRLSQSYPSSSFIWEVITYENDTNRIDVQLGSRNNPGSDNHYFGVYSSNSSLYQFPTISNAGYQINSTYDVPAWATISNIYSKVTPFGLSSSWQPIKNVYIKESGVWKMVHPVGGSGGSEPVYFFCKRSTYENDTYGNKGGTGIATFQNDTFIVPNGVTTITVELWGGGGSGGAAVYGGDSDKPPVLGALAGNGGGGGYVKATLSVTPGETLIVRVGGGAWHYAPNVIKHPSLTISGLLNNNIQVVSRRTDQNLANQDLRGGIGGSGGGYSAIFRGNTPLLVAGGGGGGGGTNSYQQGGQSQGGSGGAGGGTTGQIGSNGYSSSSSSLTNTGYGGGGGTQTAGGAGGAGTTNSLCFSTNAESGGYLVGGRGKNSPEYQGNLSGSVLLVDNGTASNPGTNGGAAGGGSGRTNTTVCNGGSLGAIQVNTSSLYAPANCGGGGGGGYYGGGGGGVGRANVSIEDVSTGGGGGGGGSNYVGGALSVISNNQGTGTVPGNTTSSYYLTSYLYPPQAGIAGVPFNAFAQGGVGYGGVGGYTPPDDNATINYGSRGENGLVVIYW